MAGGCKPPKGTLREESPPAREKEHQAAAGWLCRRRPLLQQPLLLPQRLMVQLVLLDSLITAAQSEAGVDRMAVTAASDGPSIRLADQSVRSTHGTAHANMTRQAVPRVLRTRGAAWAMSSVPACRPGHSRLVQRVQQPVKRLHERECHHQPSAKGLQCSAHSGSTSVFAA